MRLVLGSDLHGYLPEVPSCDVLVLAGDLFPEHEQERFVIDLRRWLKEAPAKNIVATLGNHDHEPFRDSSILSNLRWKLLIDSFVLIDGLKFYGTPWCLPMGRWAWQAPEYLLKKIYAMIPKNTDILISHTPPYGMCDLTVSGDLAGSRALGNRLRELSSLKYLVCGHIHEARGQKDKVLNVSCLDARFELRKNPWT